MMLPPSPSRAPSACPRCGAGNTPTARFCTTCGEALAPGLRLRVLRGPAPQPTVTLTTEPATIGRLPGSTLRLDDPGISRAHARVAWDGAGFALSDLGSSSGTFVNGARLAGPVYLRPGDRITLGVATELLVEGAANLPAGGPGASAPAAPPGPPQPRAHVVGIPPAAPRAAPARSHRRGCQGGCLVAGALLALVALAGLVITWRSGWPPSWPPQIGDILGGGTTPVADAPVPAQAPLPDAAAEGPAIEATLGALADALRAGDVEAAGACFAPEVRADYRELLAAHPEGLAAMAEPLERASLSFLSPVAGAEDGRRSAEVAVQADGITFYVALVKVEGRWLVKTL